jgi:flagellar biosynthesis/type III secretory pathway M-ring protein FliF/YscJ
VRTIKAIPGFTYTFDKLPIEVRAESDPFAGKPEEEELEAKDKTRTAGGFSILSFLKWLAFIIFIILLILLIVIIVIGLLASAASTGYHPQQDEK